MFKALCMPVICQAVKVAYMFMFNRDGADQWQRVGTMLYSARHSPECTLMQEFPQRLKNFLRNAELVRDYNAEHSKEPSKV